MQSKMEGRNRSNIRSMAKPTPSRRNRSKSSGTGRSSIRKAGNGNTGNGGGGGSRRRSRSSICNGSGGGSPRRRQRRKLLQDYDDEPVQSTAATAGTSASTGTATTGGPKAGSGGYFLVETVLDRRVVKKKKRKKQGSSKKKRKSVGGDVDETFGRQNGEDGNEEEVQYLVKWYGYDEKDATWEPEANLTNDARAEAQSWWEEEQRKEKEREKEREKQRTFIARKKLLLASCPMSSSRSSRLTSSSSSKKIFCDGGVGKENDQEQKQKQKQDDRIDEDGEETENSGDIVNSSTSPRNPSSPPSHTSTLASRTEQERVLDLPDLLPVRPTLPDLLPDAEYSGGTAASAAPGSPFPLIAKWGELLLRERATDAQQPQEMQPLQPLQDPQQQDVETATVAIKQGDRSLWDENAFQDRMMGGAITIDENGNKHSWLQSSAASVLVQRCKEAYEWEEDFARRVLAEYVKFCNLKIRMEDSDGTDQNIVPPDAIHAMWKAHYVDSLTYAQDIQSICGPNHYIHYNDYALAEDHITRPKRVASTEIALMSMFGLDGFDEEIWTFDDNSDDNVDIDNSMCRRCQRRTRGTRKSSKECGEDLL